MKKNVKVIASLVRKAKKKLYQGKRDEALELMRKAVSIDDNNGVLVQVIKVIGKKKVRTGLEDDDDVEFEDDVIAAPEPPKGKAANSAAASGGMEHLNAAASGGKEHLNAAASGGMERANAAASGGMERANAAASGGMGHANAAASGGMERANAGASGGMGHANAAASGGMGHANAGASDREEYGEVEDHRSQSVDENEERTQSMAEDRLQKLFEASDMEYENGHQQKAIAYLKKARQLAPDSQEVTARIDLLRIRIKSANLVQIARKKLESGNVPDAVSFARQAFLTLPQATGLDLLLADLESWEPGAVEGQASGSSSAGVTAQEYIAQIRQMVQDNALVAAAELADRAHSVHPADSLLAEFVENFKKLGLLE
ncbi:MAG: hypothetical protein AVO35_06430 [Candidatus Aegiribacteria sp. MLS_C]|nr:MAG: hypothetical protein AVO35_06430 [Candidatus Aegiribacteria sp. MLS_C]